MKVAQVKGDPSLVRDLSNRALLVTDNEALAAYKLRKRAQTATHDRLNSLEEKMDLIINMLTKGTTD